MKAALLNTFGAPLSLVDVPDPHAGAGEGVVKVLATPVLSYAREVFDRARNYSLLLPLTPGVGAIRVVDETGQHASAARAAGLLCSDRPLPR
jgi:alcohol dehydrogenase